jgi:hypothetical protein
MAFVDPQTASLTYVLVDSRGKRANFNLDVPWGTEAGVAILAASTFRLLLEAVSGCVCVSQSLAYTIRNNFPDPADAGSVVWSKGALQFVTEFGKTVTYQIPAIQANMLQSDGVINEDMPAMAALINGIIAADAIFTDSHGDDITGYRGGYHTGRAPGKQQRVSKRGPDADILP